ncbi:MAG: FMN-binding protein, partial [Clostridia bacterium]|nr:FMN-binding protein [Clostridia bacterium]
VMMVGVDNSGKVLGISIISHTESAGLGAVAASKNSAGQAANQHRPIEFSKNGKHRNHRAYEKHFSDGDLRSFAPDKFYAVHLFPPRSIVIIEGNARDFFFLVFLFRFIQTLHCL